MGEGGVPNLLGKQMKVNSGRCDLAPDPRAELRGRHTEPLPENPGDEDVIDPGHGEEGELAGRHLDRKRREEDLVFTSARPSATLGLVTYNQPVQKAG